MVPSMCCRSAGFLARLCRSARTRTACPIASGHEQGHLLTFPGRTTDPKAVALKIAELHGRYNIQALAFDRWRIEDLKRELSAIGCNVELIPFGQGFKDMAPRRRCDSSAWWRKANCVTAIIRS